MGNYITTKEEVRNFLTAHTPFIVINTAERNRAERLLRELSEEMCVQIMYYTDAKQLTTLNGTAAKDLDHDPLPYFSEVFRKKRGCIAAFGDMRHVSDDNSTSREMMNLLYTVRENNGTVILISNDRVWQELCRFGMLTSLSLPTREERLSQVVEFVGRYSGRYPISWDNTDIHTASALLKGFTEIQIENILSYTIVRNGGLSHDNLSELTAQKDRLYSSVAGIVPVAVKTKLSVSGLDHLKAWLCEKKKVFFASESELEKRGLSAPKGILLAGVPGCGKSYSAKMTASEWNLPLYRFDIGMIYDKYVGESEKRMKEALDFLDNVSPCVVWIDEIEKALSVSDSGNDVGKRVLGQFLFWLQESASRVFLVATANDIVKMPYELFRKGRFSEVFFVDLPNKPERAAAIVQYADSALKVTLEDHEIELLAELSDGFSYSDIECAVKDVAESALVYGQQSITMELLSASFKSTLSISQSNPEMVRNIREWGHNRAVNASEYNGGTK